MDDPGGETSAPIRFFGASFLLLAAAATAFGQDVTRFVEMPESPDGSYRLSSGVGSGRHWGRSETIRHLLLVAREWRARHPEGPVLAFGDISKPEGGPFPPHKTHDDGLAIDVTTRGPNVCSIGHADQETSLELARLFVQFGARQILYNHAFVIDRVPEVERWPDHDDHFHVVVDPARVPDGEGPFLVPAQNRTSGFVAGIADFRDEKGLEREGATPDKNAGLLLAWNYLAERPGWQRAFRVAVEDAGGGTLHDSGWVDSGDVSFRLPVPLQAGSACRWMVETRSSSGETLRIAWQDFGVDLSAPSVVAIRPVGGEEVQGKIIFSWSYRDDSGKQARYRVEVDDDSRHEKVAHRLPAVAGDAKVHAFEERLRPGRAYYWRVVAEDAAGNAAATDWSAFRTSASYRGGRIVRVTADDLNLRSGPGVNHSVLGRLNKGDEVEVLEESEEWLKVACRRGGRVWVGYVHSDFVEE
ncbi:MAG: penicillin-insensitive murein endopeptidase [Planctomycetes bacterium]|nr:penicillin-insensitive murein endopeptidase [Planctomycetota bacterium]